MHFHVRITYLLQRLSSYVITGITYRSRNGFFTISTHKGSNYHTSQKNTCDMFDNFDSVVSFDKLDNFEETRAVMISNFEEDIDLRANPDSKINRKRFNIYFCYIELTRLLKIHQYDRLHFYREFRTPNTTKDLCMVTKL